MKDQTGNDYGLLLSKQYLDRTLWAESRAHWKRRDNWDDNTAVVVVDKTTDSDSIMQFAGDLTSVATDGQVLERVQQGDQVLGRGFFPIHDASGNPVGAMFVVRDVTGVYVSMLYTQYGLIALTVGGLVLIAVFALILLGRLVFSRLDRIIRVATRVVGGDYKTQIEVSSEDEAGQFERLFEQFRRLFVDVLSHVPELPVKTTRRGAVAPRRRSAQMTFFRERVNCLFVAALIGAFTTSVSAQAPQSEPPATSPVAGFQDGFFVQSSNGDYRLLFGMVAQTDGRFSLDTPKPIMNTFTVRKVRPTFTGRVAKYVDFKVMPDFGNGTAVVQDAYFDFRFSPVFRIRTGKDKTPVGYELLEGDANLLFPERALASSLVPNRDIGIQVQGDLNPKVFYAAGVFNGIPDGTSTSTECDTNNAKDLAARVVVQPFKAAKMTAGPLNGFGFQVGGSHGQQTGALPSFKTSVQQTYFSYAAGAAANGRRNRVSPAVFYYYKSFGGFAEYMHSTQRVSRGDTTRDVANHAWEATASVLVTGEAASYGMIRPKNPFDPSKGQWGALQLLGRYTVLTVEQAAFDAGLVATTASRAARSFTIAANWYPSQAIKVYATFEHTTFEGGASRKPENVVLYRTQLGF